MAGILAMGTEDAVLGVDSGTHDEILPVLDAFAEIVTPFGD